MHKPILKNISMILVASFVLQDISWAAPELLSQVLNNSTQKIELSSEFSKITADHQGKLPKHIIHIQDAHTNLSAQKNISKVIEELVTRYKVQTVFVEGGTKDDSLTFLRPLADKATRERVAKKYMIQGEMAGEEYLSLSSDLDFKIIGVEDLSLYKKDLEYYRSVAHSRDKIFNYLHEIDKRADTLKRQLYPESLLDLDQVVEKFEKKEADFTEYYDALSGEAKKAGVNLLGYPQFLMLGELKAKESQIDFKIANDEQAAVFQELQKAKPDLAQELKEIAGKTQKMKRGSLALGSFYERLLNESKQLTLETPELIKYAEYLDLYGRLHFEALLLETQTLERDTFMRSLSSVQAVALYESSAYLKRLRSLFSLQATREDVDAYLEARKEDRFRIVSVLAFLNRTLYDLGREAEVLPYDSIIEDDLKTVEGFYEATRERDQVFVQKALDQMDKQKISSAVLITGGYHTSNLKKLLADRGVSYTVVTPHVFEETNITRYEKLLLSQFGASGSMGSAPMLNFHRAKSFMKLAPGVERPGFVDAARLDLEGHNGARLSQDTTPGKAEAAHVETVRSLLKSVTGLEDGRIAEAVKDLKKFDLRNLKERADQLSGRRRMIKELKGGPLRLTRESKKALYVLIYDGISLEVLEKLDDAQVVLRAIADLGELGTPHALDLIMAVYEQTKAEPRFRVQRAAIQALEKNKPFYERQALQDPQMQPFLDQLLKYLNKISSEDEGADQELAAQIWDKAYDMAQGDMIRFADSSDPDNSRVGLFRSTEDDVDEGVIHISSGGERYTYQVGQDGVWRRGEHRLLSIGARLAANKRVNRWVLAAPLLALGIYTPGFIRSRVKRAELKKEEHRLAVKEALRPFLEGFELSAPAASIKPAHTITTIKVAITDPLNEAELEKMTQQILKVQANSPARSYDKIFLSEARVRQLVRNRQVLTVNAVVDGEYRIVAAIFFNVSKMGKIKKYSQISDPEKHDIIRGDVLYDFWVITDDDYKKVSAIPFADTLVHQTAELAERAGWVVMAYSRPGELYKRLGPTEKRFINKFWDRPFVRAYRARIAIQHLLKARLDRDEAYSTKPFEKWLAAKYKIDTYGKSKIAKDLRTILSPSLKTNTIDPSKNTEITKLIGLLFMQFVSEVRGLDLMDPALGKLHTRLGGHMVAIYFSRDEDENALGMNVIMSYEAVNDIDNEINRLMYIMGYSKRVSGARLSVLNGDKGLAKKNKVLFDRADTLLSDREVRAIREHVIVDAKGISLGSVIALLHEAGIWNLMNGKPVSMDQIVDLATKRMGGANEGYLHGALSSLESEGFLASRTPKPDIRDERAYLNHKIFELTDKGRLMLELAPAYVKASQLIPVLKRMTEYLMGPETTGPPLELGSDTDLSSILNDIRELKMKYSDAAHLTAINHIEGMIVGPISIAFRRAIFEEGIADLENSFDLSAIPGGHIDRLRIAAQFLADRGSLTIDGDRAQFTPRGIVALSKAGAYGVPASYDQSYEWETSRIFLFGTPAELAQMAAKNLENIKQFGKEWLVDRELNVWGSEMAHETYKTLLREALLLMFNLPLELQPKVFTGIGVGTGWFEIFAYQTMRDGRHGEGTLRWKNIKTNPLVIIGADLNEVSLKITEARYKEAGIPYFSVVQADISKLAEFKQKVDMELIQLQARRPDLYPGQKLTSADSSFETTMLIHNRPFVDPTRMEGEGLSDAEIVQLVNEFGVTETFVGPDGRSITIFDHIQNLYKHFMSWKELGGPLGLLTLELFSVDPKIASLHPTRSMDGTYRWTHTVSNQLLVRWKLWLAVAKKAGLVSISQVQAVKPDKPTDDLGATGVFWLVPQESAADLQSHLAGAQSAEGARLASESDHDLSALNLERERLEADLALSHTQAGLVRHSIATLETELGNIKKASGSELADKTKRMNEIGAEISGLNKDLENFRGQAEAINAALRLLNQKIKAAVRALELQERSLWQTAMDNLAELLMQAPDNLVWTELARYLRESKDGFGAGPVTGIISFLQRNRSQLSSMSDLTEVFEGSSSAALSIKLRKLLEQMDNQPILVRIRAAQEREREREAEDYLSEADSAAVMAQIEQTIRVNDLTTEEKALLQQQLDVLTGHHEKLPRMTRAARDHVREILGEIADREKSWKSGSAVSRNLPESRAFCELRSI
jgi:DNA-binding PadR family transcriptional regulator